MNEIFFLKKKTDSLVGKRALAPLLERALIRRPRYTASCNLGPQKIIAVRTSGNYNEQFSPKIVTSSSDLRK